MATGPNDLELCLSLVPLTQNWNGCACSAISLLRLPATIDWLLSLVQNAAESTAMLALSALAILNYDARVVERAAEVVQSRDLADLNEMFTKKFAR